ncbi:MAG: hypothetical protein ABRQ26_03240 [Syntrophomonadaceae bacterium]
MNTSHRLQSILEDIEKLDKDLGELASGCEFTRQRRLCQESQDLLDKIQKGLTRGFSDLKETETYTGILDRI